MGEALIVVAGIFVLFALFFTFQPHLGGGYKCECGKVCEFDSSQKESMCSMCGRMRRIRVFGS